MKIAFHSNSLPYRGTNVVVYDYARYNQLILGNESAIIADANEDLSALEKFQSAFPVFLYKDFKEVDDYISAEKIDFLYLIKAGINDGKLSAKVKNGVHTVFKFFEPHGDVYAYVSQWLANEMSGGKYPYVPHIINLAPTTKNLRQNLRIPEDALVFGYYGGPTSFNLEFVVYAIYLIAKKYKNIYFLFMNVDPITPDIENIIYLPGSFDLEVKAAFINACNACLHARMDGETFGLTIGEFSSFNKPIITYSGRDFADIYDKSHLSILKEKALIYSSIEELLELILNFRSYENKFDDWNCYREFSPGNVMHKFDEVFLR